MLSQTNQAFKSAVVAAFVKLTNGAAEWRNGSRTNPKGDPDMDYLCYIKRGDNEFYTAVTKVSGSVKRHIRIAYALDTATGWPDLIYLDHEYKRWLPFLKAQPTTGYQSLPTEFKNAPEIRWERADKAAFPAILWHEFAGHSTAEGGNHHLESDLWNNWKEGLKDQKERDPKWGVKFDPATVEENKARKALGIPARAPWYYGYNNRPE